MSVEYEVESDVGSLRVPGPPTLIGKFPTASASNFKFASAAGVLVFSDDVYADGDLTTVKTQDKAWEERGDSALVYDETFERHWDHWIGPKRSSLFSVKLTKTAGGSWLLGDKFINLLNGTGHVSAAVYVRV